MKALSNLTSVKNLYTQMMNIKHCKVLHCNERLYVTTYILYSGLKFLEQQLLLLQSQ